MPPQSTRKRVQFGLSIASTAFAADRLAGEVIPIPVRTSQPPKNFDELPRDVQNRMIWIADELKISVGEVFKEAIELHDRQVRGATLMARICHRLKRLDQILP